MILVNKGRRNIPWGRNSTFTEFHVLWKIYNLNAYRFIFGAWFFVRNFGNRFFTFVAWSCLRVLTVQKKRKTKRKSEKDTFRLSTSYNLKSSWTKSVTVSVTVISKHSRLYKVNFFTSPCTAQFCMNFYIFHVEDCY